ncbi:MAG: hypothetical protein JWP01_705 [Myxococcales bacterium]|nr:hypothetical protein [Myxococcales bacterium]
MDTNWQMRSAAAAVTGARHLRAGRNGQDAAAAWTGERMAAEPLGAIVVCDGCGSGASSEVGARLGAQLVLAALTAELLAGQPPTSAELWARVRGEVAEVLARIVAAMPGDREQIIHDHFLFTIVAAAVAGDHVGVWVLGDGAYAIAGGQRAVSSPRVLGPFENNQPPYLAYDLLGAPATAHLETAHVPSGSVIVATDGVAEIDLASLTSPSEIERYLRHSDALRRRLAVLATSGERIDWHERRIDRRAASLQDDGAIAILAWGGLS